MAYSVLKFTLAVLLRIYWRRKGKELWRDCKGLLNNPGKSKWNFFPPERMRCSCQMVSSFWIYFQVKPGNFGEEIRYWVFDKQESNLILAWVSGRMEGPNEMRETCLEETGGEAGMQDSLFCFRCWLNVSVCTSNKAVVYMSLIFRLESHFRGLKAKWWQLKSRDCLKSWGKWCRLRGVQPHSDIFYRLEDVMVEKEMDKIGKEKSIAELREHMVCCTVAPEEGKIKCAIPSTHQDD